MQSFNSLGWYGDIDLNTCENQPIHIPGLIQPHGLLFLLQEPEFKIIQISENCSQILGITSEDLLNKTLDILVEESYIKFLKECCISENLAQVNPIKLSIVLRDRTLYFDGIIHRNNQGLILELEPFSPHQSPREFLSFYHLVRASAMKLQTAATLQQMCEIIVRELRQMTYFDRVMVYKFERELNGTVIAEEKEDNLPELLGLNYPASDIPKPARQLYLNNWLRLIADINYQPIEIVPQENPLTQQPIDLSYSVLRSVSPLHIEYLQNMGVRASMSISLIKDNQLWGLIACHHQHPKYVSYEVRKACEFLGQVMSVELASKEGNQDYEYRLKLKSISAKLVQYMSPEKNFINGLLKYQPNLLDLTDAQGAVVWVEGNSTTLGNTPTEPDIKKLIQWLDANLTEPIFHTNCLAKHYPEAEKYKDSASGLLAIRISATHNHYLLWFRSEVIQTINWGRNPHQQVERQQKDGVRISPGQSFALWKETVKLKSLPWKDCEIEAALELRNAIISIILKKIEELAALNAALQKSEAREREKATQLAKTLEELQRTQTQLVQSEKMSSLGQLVAGIAHEINNPVNFIYGNLIHADTYTQDLLDLLNIYLKTYPQATPEIEDKSEEIDLEFVLEDLPKLLQSMKIGAERICDLVQSLRTFSRVDEAEMKPVNIHDGLDSTLLILSNRIKPKTEYPGIQIIKQYGKLPLIECYASQLNQVFMNVLANALEALEERDKHRSLEQIKTHPSQITISTEIINTPPETPGNQQKQTANYPQIRITIADNGPGMSQKVKQQVFNPFYTTKPVGKGPSLGLAISYQIVVEKHQGQFKCISSPNQGAAFVIEIPIKAQKTPQTAHN